MRLEWTMTIESGLSTGLSGCKDAGSAKPDKTFSVVTLQKTLTGTGCMHEALNENYPNKFTRPWFVWANTIFGELVLKTLHQNQGCQNQGFQFDF